MSKESIWQRVWRLHRSLLAQLSLLTLAFVMLMIGNFFIGWYWESSKSATEASYARQVIAIELTRALESPDDGAQQLAESENFQRVAAANPNFRYYAESEFGAISHGAVPRHVRFPDIAAAMRNAVPAPAEGGRRADVSAEQCEPAATAAMPFADDGRVGHAFFRNCEGAMTYIEFSGVENSPFTRFEVALNLIKNFRLEFAERYLIVAAGVLMIAVFAIYRIVASLQKVAKVTNEMNLDATGTRVSEIGLPLEVQPLVRSLNEMLQRIDHVRGKQQFFLATAAHELRTPLTVLRARLEELPESPQRSRVCEDIRKISRMIEQLLRLTKLNASNEIILDKVNLVRVAREVCADRAPLAIKRGVDIELIAESDAVEVLGDRQMMSSAISNLLDNALTVSSKGDKIDVSIDESGEISVRDHGPGIPDEAVETIYEPFTKNPPNRDGHGLGLAIVDAVMRLHRGIATTSNRGGAGATFSLRFQSAGPASPST